MRLSTTSYRPTGFALVITLSLMILLTVIAVGLLTLSSIALRSSAQSNDQQTAQANARLALLLAIGQLQTYAGPDQCTTATADLAGGADGIPAATAAAPQNDMSLDGQSKGLSVVQSGTRYWTGVWKNRDSFSKIYIKTPAPQLVQWLVSGNEVTPLTLTPASSSCGLTGAAVSDPKTAVLLVGPQTIGAIAKAGDSYVCAPLVNIQGSGAAATSTIGRYAWWVGDEGVKAKVNLIAPYQKNAVATPENSSTQRSGLEAVTSCKDYPLPGADTTLNGVISLPQVSLLASSLNPALVFHAATTDSYGVLADALQGGLRLDLSALLASDLPAAAPATFTNALVKGKNIIPSSVAPNLKGPKWDRLKDFNDFAATNLAGAGNLKVKAAATTADCAIAPVMVELRLLIGGRLVTAASGVPAKYNVHACAKIVITLANPYPYPLQWDGLDLEIKNGTIGGGTGTGNMCLTRVASGGAPADFVPIVPRTASQPAVFNYTIFQIPAATLPAGEAIAFTVAAQTIRPPKSLATITVPLVDIKNTQTDNFKNAVIFADDKDVAAASMTINDGGATAPINVELRPRGSSQILRQLERVDLNLPNMGLGGIGQIQRNFVAANASGNNIICGNYPNPFPLQLYIIQLSQPGVDYGSLFPSSSHMGLLNSTLRTYADFNLQATRIRKPIICYNPPPYFMQIAGSIAELTPLTDVTSGVTGTAFTRNLMIAPVHWGRDVVSGSTTTVLFSPPAANEPIVSLAQFQHADLTADDTAASVCHQPGNAFGNSYASPFVPRELTLKQRTDYEILNGNGTPRETANNYYDISYLLNAALWDTYFCSTIPTTASTSGTASIAPLNQKIVKLDASDESSELRDGVKASSHLLINGAFNINSTSTEAWTALLAGSKYLQHPADTAAVPAALFARSLHQTSPGQTMTGDTLTPPTGNDADSFAGFRRLDDAQLRNLAEQITRQVRLRGPFVSLSHFVNRALVALITDQNNPALLARGMALGRSGALQSALDLGGLNISPDGTQSVFSDVTVADDRLNLQADSNGLPMSDYGGVTGPRATPASFIKTSALGEPSPWSAISLDTNPGSIAGILADRDGDNRPMLTDATCKKEQGFRSTGIPGWLTQADVLQVIGPSIASRSDTFKIRAYGEALDATGHVTAKAWCEAIVQRVPGYLDPADQASARSGAVMKTANQKFGRKFNLVSFRWLSPAEI